MLRRPTLLTVILVVDFAGLLVLDVILLWRLATSYGPWHRVRQDMALLCMVAAIVDVFVLRRQRWAWLLRMGLAFGIASTMLPVYSVSPDPLTLAILIYQAGLILIGGWQLVRSWA